MADTTDSLEKVLDVFGADYPAYLLNKDAENVRKMLSREETLSAGPVADVLLQLLSLSSALALDDADASRRQWHLAVDALARSHPGAQETWTNTVRVGFGRDWDVRSARGPHRRLSVLMARFTVENLRGV